MLEEFQNQPRNREPGDADNSLNDDPGDADSDRDPEPPEPETDDPAADAGLGDEWFEIGDPYAVQNLQVQPPDRRARRASGRRATTVSGSSAGRYVAARVPNGPAADLALDATLRAAAPPSAIPSHQLRPGSGHSRRRPAH